MKLVPLLPFAAALLAGCPSTSLVPEGQDTRDFRITFDEASASSSCGAGVQGEADTFEPYSQIYRFWFPDTVDGTSVEVWWRYESDGDEDFSFFARGTKSGDLTEGSIVYAGGPYTEAKSDGDIRYSIEGNTRVQFGDDLPAGSEQYIISDSNSDVASAGCTYTLSYTGRLLAESGDVVEE